MESEELGMDLRAPRRHGWSISAVARRFRINRRTVAREVAADGPRAYPSRPPKHPLTPAQLAHIERRLLVCPVLRATDFPSCTPHDYRRHGTTCLSPPRCHHGQGDRRDLSSSPQHRIPQLSRACRSRGPGYLDAHLVLDNYGTHKTPLIHRWLLRHPASKLHFTFTYSSWINQVERCFATLTDKQIRRGTHRSTRALEALEDAIRLYLTV